jgi:hypothetical protein
MNIQFCQLKILVCINMRTTRITTNTYNSKNVNTKSHNEPIISKINSIETKNKSYI